MGWFDGASAEAHLFRTTTDGRRIYAPLGIRGPLFLVSDEAARRLQRDVRWSLRWSVTGVALLGIVARRQWGLIVAVPLIAVGGVAIGRWLARDLPRVARPSQGFRPVSRLARHMAFARATGASTLWFQFAMSAFGSLVGCASALYLRMPEGWLLAGLMLPCALVFAWHLHLLRKAKRIEGEQTT